MLYPEHYGADPFFPQESDFKVIHKDNGVGMGVISYKSFNKGDLVAHIAGEIIYDIRQHSIQIDDDRHLYDTHFAGYFLHSCDPNIFLDMQNLKVYAVRNIFPNDYLYMDYAQTEQVLYKQFACACDAIECRGWITGYKQMPDEYNEDYMNFLNSKNMAVE
ncbi:MAG: SET domain-containing protein-lysine N-methyltransferase [Gammaproteobacteria bacterium]|nr:SET domain-containing protein-lysine N-methyltransferase [Gammaproteobacteria bacterium]MDH5629222.1 SET domain-containing protein-lysine N-methyltransferase [Gammaproteobacteria bacterium]